MSYSFLCFNQSITFSAVFTIWNFTKLGLPLVDHWWIMTSCTVRILCAVTREWLSAVFRDNFCEYFHLTKRRMQSLCRLEWDFMARGMDGWFLGCKSGLPQQEQKQMTSSQSTCPRVNCDFSMANLFANQLKSGLFILLALFCICL